MRLIGYWVGPARIGYNYERKESVTLFTVAKSRATRHKTGVVIEITKAQFILSKMQPYEYMAKRALEAAQQQGWAPKPKTEEAPKPKIWTP